MTLDGELPMIDVETSFPPDWRLAAWWELWQAITSIRQPVWRPAELVWPERSES